MKILVVGDPHGKLPKKFPKKVDLILVTGDIGKADLARKQMFENIKREEKGLFRFEKTPFFEKKIWIEIYNSTLGVLNRLTRIAPVYSILGNVGDNTNSEMKIEEKKIGIKLPYIRKGLNQIKNFNLVRNRARNINGLRIGFLENFLDICWIKEFDKGNKERMKRARRETAKAKKILRNFGKIDILVSHQPPYGVLDKVSSKYKPPKDWVGKHAGSKVVLDYIKKYKPKYVFCGHIHEGKGKKKVGETIVINAGASGDYFVVDV